MQVVSVETKFGGISYGKLDDQGRLVELGGTWYPERDPDKLDKLLRQHVKRIHHDGGERYRHILKTLIL